MGFEFAHVIAAIKHRAGKILLFDAIKVDNHHPLKAQQGQVFQYLIAQGAGPHYHHARLADLLLVPPGDQAQTAEAVLAHFRSRHRDLWLGAHRLPAVISGCKRRMSPSATAASERVWVSWICRPE